MKLEDSKWVNTRKNTWREVTISEEHLRNELSYLLQRLRYVRSSADVTKVILGEPAADGTYKLSYQVSRKEV